MEPYWRTTEYWQSCNTTKLSDEELARMLKPSFDLRQKPPVGGAGSTLQHRVFSLMSWGDKVEDECYDGIMKDYSYDEKLHTYYIVGEGPDRKKYSFVYGPKKWKGQKKDEKRIITEEMRTWQPTNLQDPGLQSDSMWYNSLAIFGPTDSHSDVLRTEKTVTFDMNIQRYSDDDGKVDRLQETTYAAIDVRNPNYNNPQPAMPSGPLTPGILPR